MRPGVAALSLPRTSGMPRRKAPAGSAHADEPDERDEPSRKARRRTDPVRRTRATGGQSPGSPRVRGERQRRGKWPASRRRAPRPRGFARTPPRLARGPWACGCCRRTPGGAAWAPGRRPESPSPTLSYTATLRCPPSGVNFPKQFRSPVGGVASGLRCDSGGRCRTTREPTGPGRGRRHGLGAADRRRGRVAVAGSAATTGCAVSEIGRAPLGDHRGRPREALRHRRRTTSTRGRCATRPPCRSSTCARATASASGSSTRPRLRHAAGQGPGRALGPARRARRTSSTTSPPSSSSMMQQPPPPKPADGADVQPDPSIPYKDAAFALLSHEPPLATRREDEGRPDRRAHAVGADRLREPRRQQLAAVRRRADHALLWAPEREDAPEHHQRDVDEGRQGLPARRRHRRRRHEEARERGARRRSARASTRRRGSTSSGRSSIEAEREGTRSRATPQQVADQLKQYQEQELEKVFTNMKRVGGRPVGRVLPRLRAGQGQEREDADRRPRGAREPRRQERPERRRTIFDIIRDDANPDAVRGVAMARLGELPKDMILPKLYSLFDKKWQVRLDAAQVDPPDDHDEGPARLHAPPARRTRRRRSR